MNISNLLLWGFAATLILTMLMAVSRPLGLTRMDLPFLLGTLFTSNRNKAPLFGFAAHLVQDYLLAARTSLPAWYLPLRWRLTVTACVCLAVGAWAVSL